MTPALTELRVDQLRLLARKVGVKNVNTLRKKQLIKAIRSSGPRQRLLRTKTTKQLRKSGHDGGLRQVGGMNKEELVQARQLNKTNKIPEKRNRIQVLGDDTAGAGNQIQVLNNNKLESGNRIHVF